MSSSEDAPAENDRAQTKANKKRRLRACDMCRRRKVRCDGGNMPGNTCSNCIAFKYKCTYVETASKRLPDAGYVESLETQLAEMRKTLNKYRQLCPNVSFSDDPNSTPPPPPDSQSPFAGTTTASGSEVSSPIMHPHPQPHSCSPAIASMSPMSPLAMPDSEEFEPSDDEVTEHKKLVEALEDMSFYPKHDHFVGKSSSLMLLKTVMDMREEYQGSERQRIGLGPEPGGSAESKLLKARRPEFWVDHPWVEQSETRMLRLVFPEPDLIDSLVDNYFVETNIYLPLLHRPTFENNIREGLHRRDADFGCVLLLVCALGARASDDPRVLLDPDREMGELSQEEQERTRKWQWHSAGWKWFVQVQDSKSLLNSAAPTLADLQILSLASIFVHGTSSPHVSWGYTGVGIRYAQDIGAHRKKVYQGRSSVESELLKRAFWVLLFLDRAMSSALGRPCAAQDEDIDVDLPIACDDEYWLNPDPNLAFKQPEGKPSTITYFNCALRLAQINAFALRTIYSINKSKALMGFVGPKWVQHTVAELDSTMNRWIDSVPDHLRWNPHMENLVFLGQSALLYASYYTLQITIHRPFIPSPRKDSGISFPSLAICTNAARSCIHVLDSCAKRLGHPSPMCQMGAWSAGIVLLVNIYGAKLSGSIADPVKEMKEVHKAMDLLKTLEQRWYTAGRVWDIMYNLANVGDLPLPERGTRMSQKRARSSDDLAAPSPSSESTLSMNEPRPIAGTRRVQQYQRHATTSSTSDSPSATAGTAFSLPIHSDELGRLPLHPFFGPGTSTGASSAMGSPQLVHSGPSWFPNSFGTIPGPTSQPAPATGADPSASGEPFDAAAIEAIFSMFPPASYQPAEVPSTSQEQSAGPSYPQNLTSVLSGNLESMLAQAGAPAFQESAVPSNLDDGTLAMWSNAPTSFEWDDWSTYVTNFGSTGM